MLLTLNQILFIILTVAAVVAVVFLVQLFIQLRRTAAEVEKTMVEVRALARNMGDLEITVKDRINDVGDTLKVARKAALGLSEASLRLTSKWLPFPGKYLPMILPLASFFMKSIKKNKEKAHVE
jgi:hypothetical protein